MDLVLDNLQGLVCHKTKPKPKSKTKFHLIWFLCYNSISTVMGYLIPNPFL